MQLCLKSFRFNGLLFTFKNALELEVVSNNDFYTIQNQTYCIYSAGKTLEKLLLDTVNVLASQVISLDLSQTVCTKELSENDTRLRMRYRVNLDVTPRPNLNFYNEAQPVEYVWYV